MTISRRRFLGLAAAGVGAAATGCSISTPTSTGQLLPSSIALPRPFTVPLPPMPVLQPTSTAGGRDVFDLVQRPAKLEVLPGVRTDLLTYGGTFPGPLLETRSGRPAVVRHRNALDVPVSVHLHGGHTPSTSDGYPTDLVHPGESRNYAYPMRQRAAMLWYHDHRMDFTGEHVYRGLLGVHLVRDDEEDALPLPRGDREVVLAIVDRSFDEHGQLHYPSSSAGEQAHHHADSPGVDDAHIEGVLGDVMLVNGAPWPALEVDAARYRLRLLNGCSSRRLDLVLDPPPPVGAMFTQVGSDGGLLTTPIAHEHLVMAQAERFDVLADFSKYRVGTHVTLRNRFGSGPTGVVMRFVVARRAGDDSAPADRLPDQLSEIEPLDTTGARVREWSFTRGEVHGRSGWVINGEPFDPEVTATTVPLGKTEIWRFRTDLHHPVHVHLDPFQVIGRGTSRSPGPFDHGWKDTVDVRPAEYVDVAVRFTDYAGRYLIHCHNLEHEDRMMMAAFTTA
jgi:FtsP/CotA-like multicopper oxidase with cupredoxin domain